MNRVRLTVVHEFDYHGDVDEAAVDRLVNNFAKDPTGFLHPGELAWDEILIIDVEDITDEDS